MVFGGALSQRYAPAFVQWLKANQGAVWYALGSLAKVIAEGPIGATMSHKEGRLYGRSQGALCGSYRATDELLPALRNDHARVAEVR